METKPDQFTDFIEVSPETTRKFLDFDLNRFDIQKIKDDVSGLKASYESPLERVKLLLKNPMYILQNGDVSVPYWLSTGQRPQGGSCVDIAEDLRFKWDFEGFTDELNSKNLDLLVCIGQEPKFFPRKEDRHIYLAIAKKKEPRATSWTSDNMIVIDPAFQNVDYMPNSHYRIEGVLTKQIQIANPLNQTLTPLAYRRHSREVLRPQRENKLVLSLDKTRSYLLSLTVIKNNGTFMPGIEVVDTENNRKVVFFDKTDSTLINPKVAMSPPMNESTNQMLEDAAKRLTGIRFQHAKYVNDEPVDNNGVPLTAVVSHFVSEVSS